MNIEDRVIELKPEDLNYPFHGRPSFTVTPFGDKGRNTIYVEDTVPSYGFDKQTVIKYATIAEKKFPIGFKPTYYISPFELEGRTNGAAWKNEYYGKDAKKNGEAHPFAPYHFRGEENSYNAINDAAINFS